MIQNLMYQNFDMLILEASPLSQQPTVSGSDPGTVEATCPCFAGEKLLLAFS